MSTEKLIFALRQVLRSEQEEQDARERYEGCEWGYHGFRWSEASRKAGEELAEAMNEVIDARVRALLVDVELHRPSSGNA